ncbi:MAG: CRTAC1 family protein [Candidatus Latescibacterota bacterium]
MTLLLFLFLATPLLGACGRPQAPPQTVTFVDIAAAAGLDLQHCSGATGQYYYVETYGSGAAFLDYDGDGWQDVYLVSGSPLPGMAPPPAAPVNRLFRNRGDGTFADVTAASGTGHPGYGMGCCAGDYDNDGDQDLYVANFGPNVLYRNEGDGSFTDVTAQAGVGDGRWGSSCGFLDHDGDGDLDLFVANYVEYTLDDNRVCQKGHLRSYCDPEVYEPVGDVLYRNEGNGTFTDVTAPAGADLVGRGLGVAFQDYDRDGDTDLYVANDGMMNFLYQNQGGRFAEVGLQAGARFAVDGQARAGMGVDFGDYDGDGWPDLVIGNFSFEGTTLFRNLGDGGFADVSAETGVSEPTYRSLTFGAAFVDFDNDGDADILATNGHVLDNIEQVTPGLTYAEPNVMLGNQGDGRFADVSARLGPGFTTPNVARGTAVGDYDNDGDVDVLINTVAGRPRLLRNDGGNQQHWLLVQLVGSRPRDGLGARVTVRAGGRTQVRERQSGGSYQAAHDPRLHFGLGQATRARLSVRWPDGAEQDLGEVEADRVVRVVQP